MLQPEPEEFLSVGHPTSSVCGGGAGGRFPCLRATSNVVEPTRIPGEPAHRIGLVSFALEKWRWTGWWMRKVELGRGLIMSRQRKPGWQQVPLNWCPETCYVGSPRVKIVGDGGGGLRSGNPCGFS